MADVAEETTVAAVRVEDVCYSRRNAEGATVNLLNHVSIFAQSGKITAVIGPSGGGKSTLLRLINRLADPDSGSLYLDGNDTKGMDPLELRRLVALVPQKPYMFEGSMLENLLRPFIYRQEKLPPAHDEEVARALTLAKLDPGMMPRDARSLSLGEQQRVGLARALLMHPRVLLLDEPTSALDRRTADSLAATLQDVCHSQNLTLVMVTHDLRLTERVADYCYYLEAGRILEEGRANEMLSRPRTEALKRFLSEPIE